MKNFILTLTALFSLVSFAGDGGFESRICVSVSGRTFLSFKQDFYSASLTPNKVIFGIDGDFYTYAPEFSTDANGFVTDEVRDCEDDCTNINYDYASRILSINSGESIDLIVQFSKNGKEATVLKGSADPREGRFQTEDPIVLICKSYTEEP